MAAFLAAGGEGTPPRTSMTLGAGDTGGTVNWVEAIVHGEWKLINGTQPCSWTSWQGPMFPNTSATQKRRKECLHEKTAFLFNIREDPHETTNLAEKKPQMTDLLLKRLAMARHEYVAMPRLEATDKSSRCRPSAWSASGPPLGANGKLRQAWAATHGCGQFHTDHDRGDRHKQTYCEEFVTANQGFLGPYMEGRIVQHTQEERRSLRQHPFAFADPDVYTDD